MGLEADAVFFHYHKRQPWILENCSLKIERGERVAVAAPSGYGKTTLALSFIRLLYQLDIVKYDRTATIDAVQLNQVSIEDYGEELKNCNLIIENARNMNLYVEFESLDDIGAIIAKIKGMGAHIYEVDIDHGRETRGQYPSAVFSIGLQQKRTHARMIAVISELDHVRSINEIM